MTYGRTCPRGFLPVFSVETEAEARRLLVMACQTDAQGNFIARELINPDGTVPQGVERLDRFYAFGRRLERLYEEYVKGKVD